MFVSMAHDICAVVVGAVDVDGFVEVDGINVVVFMGLVIDANCLSPVTPLE